MALTPLTPHSSQGTDMDERNKDRFTKGLSDLPAPTISEKSLLSVAQKRVQPLEGWKRLRGTVGDPVEKFYR